MNNHYPELITYLSIFLVLTALLWCGTSLSLIASGIIAFITLLLGKSVLLLLHVLTE